MRCAPIAACFIAIVVVASASAAAGRGHPVARPWDAFASGDPSFAVERESVRIPIGHLDLGAEHILDQQCGNGGFGWPHDSCTATVHNITGPILLGVLGAVAFTGDNGQLVGAINGGAYDLTYQFANGEFRFTPFNPIFMFELARASGNSVFATHVANEFFAELAAGTYGPDDLDTAGWISALEADRTGIDVNLRAWDLHTLIRSAQRLGLPGQAALFEQAVLDGLATMDSSDPAVAISDMVGIAGAVRGLAFARRSAFPAISAPLHPGVDGIATLEDLAAFLASLQNPDGSWDWHSNLAAPTLSDEDVQATAYALLALLEADVVTVADYRPLTGAARDWLASMQLPNGGFPEGPGLDENTEVEGEALLAIASFDATIFVDGFEAGSTVRWDAVAP